MISKIIDKIKKFIKDYKITNIISVLLSIILAIIIDNGNDILEVILLFLITLGLCSFLIETVDKKKIPSYIVGSLLSIVLALFSHNSFNTNNTLFMRISIFIWITLFLMAIYFNYKKINKSFSKYLLSIFQNSLMLGIVGNILVNGVIFILMMFTELIFQSSDILIIRTMIIFLGIYYGPSIIYSLSTYNEPVKAIKIINNRILNIFLMLSYVVLYLYIFKIIILNTIPKNIIFLIITIIFGLTFLINTMCYDTEDNKIFKKINSIIPYLLIPLYILQSYALIIRIVNNSLTTTRYIGIAILIIELIYIIMRIIKKDLANLVYVVIIVTFISLLAPYVNMITLPEIIQYKYLEEYKKTGIVTKKVQGAYYYLSDYPKTIVLLTNEDIAIIKDTKFEVVEEKYTLFYAETEINELDIKEYSKLNFVDNDNYEFDYYPIIQEYILNKNNIDEYFKNHHTFIVDGKKLILSYISYEVVTDEFYFNGYLLER